MGQKQSKATEKYAIDDPWVCQNPFLNLCVQRKKTDLSSTSSFPVAYSKKECEESCHLPREIRNTILGNLTPAEKYNYRRISQGTLSEVAPERKLEQELLEYTRGGSIEDHEHLLHLLSSGGVESKEEKKIDNILPFIPRLKDVLMESGYPAPDLRSKRREDIDTIFNINLKEDAKRLNYLLREQPEGYKDEILHLIRDRRGIRNSSDLVDEVINAGQTCYSFSTLRERIKILSALVKVLSHSPYCPQEADIISSVKKFISQVTMGPEGTERKMIMGHFIISLPSLFPDMDFDKVWSKISQPALDEYAESVYLTIDKNYPQDKIIYQSFLAKYLDFFRYYIYLYDIISVPKIFNELTMFLNSDAFEKLSPLQQQNIKSNINWLNNIILRRFDQATGVSSSSSSSSSKKMTRRQAFM